MHCLWIRIGLVLLISSAAEAQERQAWMAGPFQATSALGRKLYAMADSDGTLKTALAHYGAHATDPKEAVALSKAYAAKRQYREAVEICSKAIATSPRDADLYTERGHRELGLREFQKAEADLRRATELNSKLLDAHYHLGLAHYFQSQFAEAAESFGRALALAQNNDSVIDCSNWLYVSDRRAGKSDAAQKVLDRITPDITNNEPHLYFYLRLLRFYQGKLSEMEIMPRPAQNPADIEGELSYNTIRYGLGNWHLYNGDMSGARRLMEPIVRGFAWNSWGFIGAEKELSTGLSK